MKYQFSFLLFIALLFTFKPILCQGVLISKYQGELEEYWETYAEHGDDQYLFSQTNHILRVYQYDQDNLRFLLIDSVLTTTNLSQQLAIVIGEYYISGTIRGIFEVYNFITKERFTFQYRPNTFAFTFKQLGPFLQLTFDPNMVLVYDPDAQDFLTLSCEQVLHVNSDYCLCVKPENDPSKNLIYYYNGRDQWINDVSGFQIQAVHKNTLYIGNDKGVFRYDDATKTLIKIIDVSQRISFLTFHEDFMMVGLGAKVLRYQLSTGMLNELSNIGSLPIKNLLYYDTSSTVYTSTFNRLVMVDKEEGIDTVVESTSYFTTDDFLYYIHNNQAVKRRLSNLSEVSIVGATLDRVVAIAKITSTRDDLYLLSGIEEGRETIDIYRSSVDDKPLFEDKLRYDGLPTATSFELFADYKVLRFNEKILYVDDEKEVIVTDEVDLNVNCKTIIDSENVYHSSSDGLMQKLLKYDSQLDTNVLLLEMPQIFQIEQFIIDEAENIYFITRNREFFSVDISKNTLQFVTQISNLERNLLVSSKGCFILEGSTLTRVKDGKVRVQDLPVRLQDFRLLENNGRIFTFSSFKLYEVLDEEIVFVQDLGPQGDAKVLQESSAFRDGFILDFRSDINPFLKYFFYFNGQRISRLDCNFISHISYSDNGIIGRENSVEFNYFSYDLNKIYELEKYNGVYSHQEKNEFLYVTGVYLNRELIHVYKLEEDNAILVQEIETVNKSRFYKVNGEVLLDADREVHHITGPMDLERVYLFPKSVESSLVQKGNELYYLHYDPTHKVQLHKYHLAIESSTFDLPSKSITVSPNPSYGLLKIKNIDPTLIESIVIIDLEGRALYQPIAYNNELDISKLRNGMYILKILFEDGRTSSIKFVKI